MRQFTYTGSQVLPVSDPSDAGMPPSVPFVLDASGNLWQWNGTSWDIVSINDTGKTYLVDENGNYLIDENYNLLVEG